MAMRIHSAVRQSSMLTLAFACHAALAANVNPDLAARAAHEGIVEALLVLPDQATPMLAPLDADADYKTHRRALVDALRARAETQQANVREWLDARGVTYRAYWISNLLWARVSAADLAALASRDDLKTIESNPHIALHFAPVEKSAQMLPNQVESVSWGVDMIQAPRVWAAGFSGQGVVVAGNDSGFQWDHPALKTHYRGWNGSQAQHDYNWHDAVHAGATVDTCGLDLQVPCDAAGHGTGTVGIAAGSDGGSNQIGVAPGARWMGCRNMDDFGDGTPQRYIECMQWLLAPTNLSGANPNPDLAPDVINNSWGCSVAEGCTAGNELKPAVDNLVAGGIFFVAAAANDGPACGTIAYAPAIYDSAFAVGATDDFDRVSSYSSRGPVAGIAKTRPDLVAPGDAIRSATINSGYAVGYGTSAAAPHAAGAAALLMSVNPALKGHPEQVAQFLRGSAVRNFVSDPYNTGCGGLTMANWPNFQAGYGRLDAWAAVVAADTIFKNGVD
ncbi:MAG: S8 family serine peptidase [Dokdonella sp.]